MAQIIYWRRELPPLSEELEGTHEVTAQSERVHHAYANRDELWGRCHVSLMAAARARIEQEVARLHGSCAHVVDESISSKSDDGTGDFWLVGTFTFVLYRHPPQAA
ncbi:MAG: hypothetical protein K8W52_18235 [Deltaproteobacteria bacterium]|nr:hypothetical protein [Deltaproteobacteria bacterium]